MPEAFAESEFMVSDRRRSKSASAAVAKTAARPWWRFLVRKPVQTIASAAFAATLTGIAVNALVMQTGRHPAPLFTWSPPVEPVRPVAVIPEPTPRPVDPIAMLPAALPPAANPITPVPVPVARPQSASRDAGDPIASLLRANPPDKAAPPRGHKAAGRND